ncbi:SU10 major capsid protein [Enterococcus faecalis]|uniref:SU10 major capsid protein n=1 Tax=Enterococcus faecalis TaxID=1351 RepID=UPI0030C88716
MKKSSINNLEYLDISQEINAFQIPSTPFLSWLLGAGKTSPAASTEIKWRESELNREDSSAQVEGGEYNDAETGRNWFSNYTEIFRKATSVSGTLDAIKVDGVGNELSNQVLQRALEMKLDLNRKLLVGVKANETGSKGRQMSGVINLINSNNLIKTATADAVTRKDVDKMFKAMFDNGYGGEKLCLVSTDMVDLMTDELDKAGTKVFSFGEQVAFGLQLGRIVSNYGTGIALIEPSLPAGTMIALDTNYVKLRPLREWRAEELAKTTDSKRIGVVGEYTVEYTASNSGAILNLATAAPGE